MNNKVSILFSISHKAPNGASSFVHAFVDQQAFFKQRGIDFHVYSQDNYRECDFSPSNKTRNLKHAIKNLILKIINHSSVLTIIYDYLAESRTARTTVSKYLGEGYDDAIIHCQEAQTAYYILKYKGNKKVIASLHNDGKDYSIHFVSRPALDSWLGRKYLSRRYKYIIQHADLIGFVSRGSMEMFASLHPEIKQKLFYVYNGIKEQPLSHTYSQNDIIRFICVANINSNKNQESVIKAISILSPEIQNRVELTIVGDGTERDRLETMVKELGLKNINFTGVCNNVPKMLSNADVFILASKSEGLPVSIIEAMREGLPILGTNVGGIPEQIIDGESGYIIESTPKGIAKIMTRIINDGAAKRERMGRRSYELFLKNFSQAKMFESYSHVYKELIEKQ